MWPQAKHKQTKNKEVCKIRTKFNLTMPLITDNNCSSCRRCGINLGFKKGTPLLNMKGTWKTPGK
jgi:hypothetical protein